jgi:hypothetical protein
MDRQIFFKTKNKEQITYDTLICFTLLLEKQDLYTVTLSLLKQAPIITKGWVQNEIPKLP